MANIRCTSCAKARKLDSAIADPGDITQIVGKLKFLLSEGETGWNEFRRNARQTIISRFDMRDYSEKLRAVYAEAANGR